jgi:hypothetical protein
MTFPSYSLPYAIVPRASLRCDPGHLSIERRLLPWFALWTLPLTFRRAF